jgi:hypothetical protein
MIVKKEILMKDGTPAEDEDMSFWWDENDKRILDTVMDFTKYYPYWEELPKPNGLIDVEKVDDIWYWIIEEK